MSNDNPPPAPPPPGAYQDPGYGVSVGGQLAQWAPRVGAYLIDAALLIPGAVLIGVGYPRISVVNVGGVATSSLTSGIPALLLLGWLLNLGIVIWNRWLRGGAGQSLGKRVVGLRLVGERTGQPIGPLQAFLRDIAHIVDSMICYIGFLFPLWDAKKQTIADKIVTSVVVAA